MIAGIISFAAIATSVAFACPCPETLVLNGLSGNVVSRGVLAEGILESGVVRSSQVGSCSDLVATPSAVSPLFAPTPCTASCPASQRFGGIVGSGSEVISTEAAVPEYSTLVSPSAPTSFGISAVRGSACGGSLSSGVSGASVLIPSFAASPVVSSRIVSAGSASPVVASFGYPCAQSGVSRVYETPVVSVVSSPVSAPLVGSSQIFSSGCGSSVFGSSGISSGVVSTPVSATVLAAPAVETANVITPVASAEFVSSGVSSESFLNEDCGC